jgi:uncharacterized protein YecE (DUF72 family)
MDTQPNNFPPLSGRGLLKLGACSWTAEGWETCFYPPGTPRNEFIREYAKRFDAVEIDATFYGTPRASTVERWRDLTPESFTFAAKVPRIITHDKFLVDCDQDLEDFLQVMDLLGPRLGPLLLQFPYFAKKRGIEFNEFLDRVGKFLECLPRERFQFALEVRNKTWLNPLLFDLLREHRVSTCLIDHPWMAPVQQLFKLDILTGPFVYVRLLGDRIGIEKITQVFNKSVVDRTADIERWVPHLQRLIDQQVQVYGFVNNHYSGHAPNDIKMLEERIRQS